MKKTNRLLEVILLCSLWIPFTGLATEGNSLSVESGPNIAPLVELYTSEGCSSCPPADKFLTTLGNSLGEELQAVPLAFHVDYWNWLGWKDPFSKAKFTKRQRLIADQNSQRSIYTPELVVSGKEARGGGQIYDWITKQNSTKSGVKILLNLNASSSSKITADLRVVLDDGVGDKLESGHQVFVALYENNIVRSIKGGENKGRTLIHDYVVRYWSDPINLYQADFTKMLNLKIGDDWSTDNLGIAVVVLDAAEGTTLQALSAPIDTLFTG